MPSFTHAMGDVGKKEIFAIVAYIVRVLMEKGKLENSRMKWLIASEGGGSAWFDIAGKGKLYRGQWECGFFIIKREKMAAL